MIDVRLALLLVGMVIGYVAPWYIGLLLVVGAACWMAAGHITGWLYRRVSAPVDEAVIERLRQTALRRQSELSERGGAAERKHAEA